MLKKKNARLSQPFFKDPSKGVCIQGFQTWGLKRRGNSVPLMAARSEGGTGKVKIRF